MKKVFLLLFIAGLNLVASAQKVYFIYLQTEDQSPFYVRMGDKIYSSASAGYLILPSLTDSTYNLNLGYAKSSEPEARFSVAINQNDRGFLIKKFEDGPALFDFEEMALIKPNASSKDNTVYTTKTDNFSNLLSKAAGDPSLVKVPVAKKEEPVPVAKQEEVIAKTQDKPVEKQVEEMTKSTAPDTTATVKTMQESNTPPAEVKMAAERQPDTAAVVQREPLTDTSSTVQAIVEDTASRQPVAEINTSEPAPYFKRTVISRRSESSTTEGFGVMYVDKYDDHIDTIRILIPSPKVKLAFETESKAPAEFMLTKEKVDSVVEKAANPVQENPVKETTAAEKKAEANPACGEVASEKDFLKLRRKMAGKDNDEDMINEAKKEFKDKCYTVEQVKFLGSLFLSSAGRYQFFDAAYQHVSDRGNFASLESELTDDYYIKRFKALVGE